MRTAISATSDIGQLRRAYIILRGVQHKQMKYDNCRRIHFEEADHEQ
ncbi:MAG: hypothetical protein ACLU9S_01335 [Oscillospiraceae bacterium]